MKTKQILFTLALVFYFALIKAQDKYEFMIIEYSTYENKVAVSINGKEFIKKKAEFDGQDRSGFNANPLLNIVNEYQNENWEVITFSAMVVSMSTDRVPFSPSELFFAYLKRKKS